MTSLPMPELLFNLLGIMLSLIAVYYWVMLYKRISRGINERRGWVWLFASAFIILLLNISSTYLLFAEANVQLGLPGNRVYINFNTLQVMEVLSRTIIVFSMTVGVYLIYNPLKSGFVYALAPVGLKSSELSRKDLKYALEPCMSYLISEKTSGEPSAAMAVGNRSSSNSMSVFEDFISHGAYGLIVTRDFPEHVRKNWKVENLPVIWLTTSRDIKPMENVQLIDPVDLVGLSHAIKDFMRKSGDSIVLIDGIEYLITQNSFNEVLKFLQAMNDFVAQSKTRVLVPLDFKAVEEKELHLFKRELCELSVV